MINSVVQNHGLHTYLLPVFQPPRSCSSWSETQSQPQVSSLKFCNCSFIFTASALSKEYVIVLYLFGHPLPCQSQHFLLNPLSWSILYKTENQTFQSISYWFCTWIIPRPPSLKISTAALCRLLGLIPGFWFAWKLTKQPGSCGFGIYITLVYLTQFLCGAEKYQRSTFTVID